MTTNDGTVGRYLNRLLVALALGAGAIHFAYSGEHFDVGWVHGTFFAVVAWFQLAWAVAVVTRPTRRLLAIGAVGNALVIGTWAVSRIWGVPIGPDAWTAESVSLADALSTALEVGIVGISLALLARPALAQHSLRPRLGTSGLGVAGLAVAVLSTMALAPAFASEHSHGHTDAAGTAPHSHAAGTPAHDHGATAADPKAAAAGADHAGHTNVAITADGSSACEKAGVANQGNSGHGHRGPVPFTPLDDATRNTLAKQVSQSNAVVAKYSTVAAAEAGGWRRITPYVPCIAAHYIKGGALFNAFDPSEPEILLFDGTDPGSKIVGLSYLQFADPKTGPEGFAGKNDPWHVHQQLCIGGGGVLGDESAGPEECEKRGGRVIPLKNLWMTHMWNVPGWESRWGLFSSEHPDLGGRIGAIAG